jgi:hypothetical protein
MKRLFLGVIVALAAVGAGTGANASANSSTVSVQVDSIATVISSINVDFDFDLYNCPAGFEIVIVEWEANEPSRADSGAASAGQSYGLSNGSAVQHLTLFAGSGGFLAGARWVGSGIVACGPFTIPVQGSGMTKSLNGV